MPFDRIDHAWETTDGDWKVSWCRACAASRRDATTARRSTSRRAGSRPRRSPGTRTATCSNKSNAATPPARRPGPHAPDSHRVRARSDRTVPAATARVRQDDGAGTVVADTLTFYDGLPLGEVGSPASSPHARTRAHRRAGGGRVRRAAPGLRGARVRAQDEAAGLVDPAGTYVRTVDAQGVVRGDLTGLRGAPSPSRSTRRAVIRPSRRRRRQHVSDRVRSAFVSPVRLTAPSGAVAAEFDALARLAKTIESGDSDDDPSVVYEYRTDALPVALTVRRRGADGGPPVDDGSSSTATVVSSSSAVATTPARSSTLLSNTARAACRCASSSRTAPRARNTRRPTTRRRTPSSSTMPSVAWCAPCDPTAASARRVPARAHRGDRPFGSYDGPPPRRDRSRRPRRGTRR